MESQRTISEKHHLARSALPLPLRTNKDQGIQIISLPGEEKKDRQKLRELSLYNNARPSTSTEHFME
jgi:hypothetical protein